MTDIILLYFRFCTGFGAKLPVQNPFAHAHVLRRNFQQFVVADKFQRLFETHAFRRNQPQRIVGRRGAGVRKMFGFADIYVDIPFLGRHASINKIPRACALNNPYVTASPVSKATSEPDSRR